MFSIGLKRTRDAWLGRLTTLFKRPVLDEAIWDELEEILVRADVGMATTDKLLEKVRARTQAEGIAQPAGVQVILGQEIATILQSQSPAEPSSSPESKPAAILVVGVNGTGKTTSIAKIAHHMKAEGRQVVLAAADTFRAAAIDQLKHWGERIGVEVIAHQPGGDPAAVVFDALEAAKRRQADFVVIDTAGRIHTKTNLMQELQKIRRVVARAGIDPEVLLVLDATTGQNGLSQARHFTEAVAVTGIFLAKLDSTAKGGIVLAIADELKLPIVYVGTGQEPTDMSPFEADGFVEALLTP